jgi:hypothetical protein
LTALVANMKRDEFYELIESRLGPGQSRVLTNRLYKGKRS